MTDRMQLWFLYQKFSIPTALLCSVPICHAQYYREGRGDLSQGSDLDLGLLGFAFFVFLFLWSIIKATDGDTDAGVGYFMLMIIVLGVCTVLQTFAPYFIFQGFLIYKAVK